jgi:hypothetical protein
MNEFIEKNRRLLHFYCETLRTIGLLILILGVVGVCAIMMLVLLSKFGVWYAPESFEMIIAMPLGAFKIFFIGIGIRGLMQFIRYLVERDYKPGWILRHGEMFFYLYALLTVLSVVWMYTIAPSYLPPSLYTRVFFIIVAALSTTVKVLILVGLGQILRRLIPVIEESKMLV